MQESNQCPKPAQGTNVSFGHDPLGPCPVHFAEDSFDRLTPGALMFMAPQVQPNLNLSMILPQYAVLCTAPEIDIL